MATRINTLFFKNLLVAALFCIPFMLSAQSIQVTDFAIDETDMTANLAESAVKDQNGRKCALIKVHTTQTGFQFDVGMLGVTKQVDQGGKHPSEIWLYVPAGVKKIDIKHPQLGELLNYDLRQQLKAAKTYNMHLSSGKVVAVVNPTLQKQFAMFTIVPANASIEVNGEAWEVDEEGRAARQLPFGTYQYRVTAPRYKAATGQFTIGKQKHTETITLTPNFSVISFQAPDEAEIWIDGQKRGTGKCDIELLAGEYNVECRQESHVSTSKVVTIAPNQPRTIELDAPRPIYGILSINSQPFGATVLIDGKEVGETPLSLDNVLIGRREVSVSLKGHYAEPQSIVISQESPSAVEFAMKKGSAPKKTPETNMLASNLTPQQVTVPSVKAEYDRLMTKNKKMKKWALWGGLTWVVTGATAGLLYEIIDGEIWGGFVGDGAILGAFASIPWMTGFGIAALKAKKKAKKLMSVESASLYQEEFNFSNGTSLTAGVDWLQDYRFRTYTPGVGLRFNF